MQDFVTFKTVDGYRAAVNPRHVRSVSEVMSRQSQIRVGETEKFIVALPLQDVINRLQGILPDPEN